MTDKSLNIWTERSDIAIERALGSFIKEMRQRQHKTQSEVAKEAIISRSTLSLMERGESGNIRTLIKILRVLGQLHVFNGFEVHEQISPLALAKAAQKKKQRVRKKKQSSKAQKSNW